MPQTTPQTALRTLSTYCGRCCPAKSHIHDGTERLDCFSMVFLPPVISIFSRGHTKEFLECRCKFTRVVVANAGRHINNFLFSVSNQHGSRYIHFVGANVGINRTAVDTLKAGFQCAHADVKTLSQFFRSVIHREFFRQQLVDRLDLLYLTGLEIRALIPIIGKFQRAQEHQKLHDLDFKIIHADFRWNMIKLRKYMLDGTVLTQNV